MFVGGFFARDMIGKEVTTFGEVSNARIVCGDDIQRASERQPKEEIEGEWHVTLPENGYGEDYDVYMLPYRGLWKYVPPAGKQIVIITDKKGTITSVQIGCP